MMMQKDEHRLLDTWLRFYNWLAGPESIFVWDNGSSSHATIECLKSAEQKGITVFWDKARPEDYERKNSFVADRIREFDLAGRFDFYLPLDCDEFLVVRQGAEVVCDRDAILSSFERYESADGPLRIAGSYYNIPTPDRGFFFWKESKVMFRRGTFASTDHGFHHGASISGAPEIETEFVHLHFQHKPLPTLLEHARNKLQLRVKDFSPETLAAYKGPGSHLVKYFEMTEEKYRSAFDLGRAIKLPQFEAVLNNIGATYPFLDEFR
jgi:hypothetical protein